MGPAPHVTALRQPCVAGEAVCEQDHAADVAPQRALVLVYELGVGALVAVQGTLDEGAVLLAGGRGLAEFGIRARRGHTQAGRQTTERPDKLRHPVSNGKGAVFEFRVEGVAHSVRGHQSFVIGHWGKLRVAS